MHFTVDGDSVLGYVPIPTEVKILENALDPVIIFFTMLFSVFERK